MLVPSCLWCRRIRSRVFLHAFIPWSRAGHWYHVALSSRPASAPPWGRNPVPPSACFIDYLPARLTLPRHDFDKGCAGERDLPHPGIEPGSPALQADSLPTELSGKPWGGKTVFQWWSCPESKCPDSLRLPPRIQQSLSWLFPGPVPPWSTAFLSSSLWEPSWSEGWITGMTHLCWNSETLNSPVSSGWT